MGSVQLLLDELPFISTRADSLVQWTFNVRLCNMIGADLLKTWLQMLSFQNNNLLQLLSVVTLASLPLSLITGILGINYFDDTRLNGAK
jgi:Mg2+ and Co2+ transporter CorA